MTRSRTLQALLFGAAVAALLVASFVLPLGDWIAAAIRWTEGRGVWTGVLLAVIWVPAALLAVPGSLLTLGTGFVLGVGWGTVVVSIGSTAGAVAAFLAGRTVGRDRVRGMIEDRPRFRAVDRAVEEEGLRIVLLVRLSPIFPYNFQNYAWSVSGVGFGAYLLGSWVGMLPATVLYAYLGSGARTLAAVAAGEAGRSTGELVLFGVGLAATVAATVLVTRAARRALEDRTGIGEVDGDA
ncbi:MAG: TVP38/TMEM64 family protein [Gemmatimonadota bacterium]|nr:TVP38/TMEM64 family protein [Gemmatimonadota bacterium]